MRIGLSGVAFSQTPGPKIDVLIITGGHGFEPEPFFKVFADNPEITFTPSKHTKDADAYEREDFLNHDVVVLYDMPKTITEVQKARFLALFQKGTGLLVLHHALVSFQDWPEYEQIIGGRYPEEKGKGGVVTPEVGYQHDVDIPVTIVAKEHPITAGLEDFTIHDEIYWGFRVRPDVDALDQHDSSEKREAARLDSHAGKITRCLSSARPRPIRLRRSKLSALGCAKHSVARLDSRERRSAAPSIP